MIVFVDGFQNTGKTSLIEGCSYLHNRFPFNQYLEDYDLLNKKEELNGFQLAKDLGILFASRYIKHNVVFDRGPFSTIFYSLKENRYDDNTPEVIMKFLVEISKFENCEYVFVTKKNEKQNNKREHNDGFDYLDDDNDLEKENILENIIKASKLIGIKLHIFENDFSKSLQQNIEDFNKFLRGLENEHNRS